MERIPFNKKLYDTTDIAEGGRVDQYWIDHILKNVFKGNRPKEVAASFAFYDSDYLVKHFGLKGFEFGNWLSQEDRYIYLAGAAFAMRDFCDIMNIKQKDFGLKGRVTVSFGARGKGGNILAHFEPSTFAINLTKHRTTSGPNKYLADSGAGSFGHEYAHAIDFFAGRYIDKNGSFNFATECLKEIYERDGNEGRKAAYKLNKRAIRSTLHELVVDSLGKIMFEEIGHDRFVDTSFYSNLKDKVDATDNMGKYWLRIIEIWARSYEVLLHVQCEAKGIHESFLKKKKYVDWIYPKESYFTPDVILAFKQFTQLVTETANK